MISKALDLVIKATLSYEECPPMTVIGLMVRSMISSAMGLVS